MQLPEKNEKKQKNKIYNKICNKILNKSHNGVWISNYFSISRDN